MKVFRPVCLLITFGAALLAPKPAAADTCCTYFEIYCDGFCADKGGKQIAFCYSSPHVEHCICNNNDATFGNYCS